MGFVNACSESIGYLYQLERFECLWHSFSIHAVHPQFHTVPPLPTGQTLSSPGIFLFCSFRGFSCLESSSSYWRCRPTLHVLNFTPPNPSTMTYKLYSGSVLANHIVRLRLLTVVVRAFGQGASSSAQVVYVSQYASASFSSVCICIFLFSLVDLQSQVACRKNSARPGLNPATSTAIYAINISFLNSTVEKAQANQAHFE